MVEVTTRSPPDPDASLESLFDQIFLTNGNDTMNQTSKETIDPDISELIELNKLTGELSFKKKIDYEELINKVNLKKIQLCPSQFFKTFFKFLINRLCSFKYKRLQVSLRPGE